MTVYAAPGPRAWRARPGCRWRDLTGFCQDQEPLCLAWVEAAVHVAAGLEGRNDLFGHRDLGAIARVSSRARVPLLDREHAKAAQFNPIPLRQRGRSRAAAPAKPASTEGCGMVHTAASWRAPWLTGPLVAAVGHP